MRDTELRLALVCYGGVSLAVYMHGITKEVWRLACASRALHDGEAPATGSQGVYHQLLAEVASAGARLRVLPDIVAGASAGGINGIFLAQAIATGQSLDPLTDLWLASADVEALIDADAAPASRFSKMWARPLAWMAAGRGADGLDRLDPETRDEVKAKLSHLVRSRWFEPPFGGAAFTGLLLDALDAMAASPRGPRLLPPGQPLDLFVTVTDFTGHPERLRLNSPPEVAETEHRVVVAFSDRGEPVDTLAALPELAFAARATSSFPGAFPPFTVGELDGVLKARRRGWPGRKAFLARVLPRRAAANAADQAVLIDGSVLANAPFRPAIEALRQRPAKRQIDRRFVYIDPTPGRKLHLTGSGEAPGWFQTILGALSDLPRQQPIRDNLEALADRSARTERLRGVVDGLRARAEAEAAALFDGELDDEADAIRLVGWRRQAHAAAAVGAGYAYGPYVQIKRIGVTDSLAALLADVGGRRTAAQLTTGTATLLPAADAPDAAQAAFFRRFDLGYRIRRLRLLARTVSAMDGGEATGGARDAIYAALGGYLECRRADRHAGLRPLLRPVRPDWPALGEALAASFDLPALDRATDALLAESLAPLAPATRRPLLLAWLGFPLVRRRHPAAAAGRGAGRVRRDQGRPNLARRRADDPRRRRGGDAEGRAVQQFRRVLQPRLSRERLSVGPAARCRPADRHHRFRRRPPAAARPNRRVQAAGVPRNSRRGGTAADRDRTADRDVARRGRLSAAGWPRRRGRITLNHDAVPALPVPLPRGVRRGAVHLWQLEAGRDQPVERADRGREPALPAARHLPRRARPDLAVPRDRALSPAPAAAEQRADGGGAARQPAGRVGAAGGRAMNRLFVALDTPDLAQAQALAGRVRHHVGGLKLGLEFFVAQGAPGVRAMAELGLPIFLDLKLHDIPNTVAKAVQALSPLAPAILTVHAAGGRAMLEDAKAAAPPATKVVAVTVLTSLDASDLAAIGVAGDPHDQVARLTDLAAEAGLDGIVCSGAEVAAAKARWAKGFFVVPGVRPADGSARRPEARRHAARRARRGGLDPRGRPAHHRRRGPGLGRTGDRGDAVADISVARPLRPRNDRDAVIGGRAWRRSFQRAWRSAGIRIATCFWRCCCSSGSAWCRGSGPTAISTCATTGSTTR